MKSIRKIMNVGKLKITYTTDLEGDPSDIVKERQG